MSDILNGKISRLPDWEVIAAVVRACLEHAETADRPPPPDLGDEAHWRRRYGDLEHDLDTATRPRREETRAGWPLAEVSDPFALEVHRPVQPDTPQPGLPELPVYVPREHDTELGRVVTAAAQGSSGIAVLVGGSSTGKTRACWEAVQLLRDRPGPWRLWHPIDPSRPAAALRELGSIGLRTVVWLNEAQFYLDPPAGGLGERVAAGLRELLRDPARAPVLVLATLWPQFWDVLTARPPVGQPDPHAQARELLAGRDISVPAAFSAARVEELARAADPRLAQAAEAAEDGQVIQFLAGAPELLARYRNAPPAAAALISAAIDARRMGMGIALPLAFLEAAAPGYLTDTDWDGLGEDWLDQALAYTATPCKGTRGPLTGIRPRTTAQASGPAYRLADYLDQHGRRARRGQYPPVEFWAAVARFAEPATLGTLAQAAEDRGLLRDAARLRKHATAYGDAIQAQLLIQRMYSLRPADHSPAQWAAAHAALDDPSAVARLLQELREAGASDQARTLLARDPAAHAALDDPSAVAWLLRALREAGASDQARTLADRAAAHAALDNPSAVAWLLQELREAGASDQARTLADRAAAHAALDDPSAVARLLQELREPGASDQARTLLARDPAAHAALDDPSAVAWLLRALKEAGASDQARTLADRMAAHAPLDNPHRVAELLRALREADVSDQARTLADRMAAHAPLDNPHRVAELLRALREAGADNEARTLADRAAEHGPLDDPSAVARLLQELREAGASDQARTLADRAAAHAALDDPSAVARLLQELREAGASDQARTLLARDPAAHAALDDPSAVAWLLRALREAGASDQARTLLARNPAEHAALDDPSAVAWLLQELREADADNQARTLADRAAEHAALGDPHRVARLLQELLEAGADNQAQTLADRAAAHAALDNPSAVAWLLQELREAGASDQARTLLARDPAAHVPLDDPSALAMLLRQLWEAGASDQARTLADRAAHAALDNPSAVAWLLQELREAGASDQARTLLARDPAAHVPLDDPSALAMLLRQLREAGASDQARTLADRMAAHAPLDDPSGVAWLLRALREADASDQARMLVQRLPAEGMFELFWHEADHQMRYRFGREPDGSPALQWGWDELSLSKRNLAVPEIAASTPSACTS